MGHQTSRTLIKFIKIVSRILNVKKKMITHFI